MFYSYKHSYIHIYTQQTTYLNNRREEGAKKKHSILNNSEQVQHRIELGGELHTHTYIYIIYIHRHTLYKNYM